MKPFQIYLAMLIVIELILSAYVTYGNYTSADLCILGGNCTAVQSSVYAQFLGIKTSVWGIISFTLLFVLYGWAHNSYKHYRLYLAASLLGALLALQFLAVQAFILHQFCSSCLVIDTLMLIIFALSLYEFHGLRKYY